jgi:hypothetical protein
MTIESLLDGADAYGSLAEIPASGPADALASIELPTFIAGTVARTLINAC